MKKRQKYRLKPAIKRKLIISLKVILFVVYTIVLTSVVSNKVMNNKICHVDLNYYELQKKTCLLDGYEQEDVYVDDKIEITEKQKIEEKIDITEEVNNKRISYRLTYYYPGDSTASKTITASGKSTKDFQVNENGWYTYQGKLVVATASSRLLKWDKYKNSTQPTYKLYDELVLSINGKEYEAIVLDVCGACMKSAKIDLFVKDKKSGLDARINVRKM